MGDWKTESSLTHHAVVKQCSKHGSYVSLDGCEYCRMEQNNND